MRILPLSLAALALLGSRPAAALDGDAPDTVARSVVKVLATVRRPDFNRPWAHAGQGDLSGSGVVIEGGRILTNAQLVKYASRVLVEPDRSGEKYAASVEFLADDVDLAILKVEDPAALEGRPPLPRAEGLPRVKDPVLAYGHPVGGENLAITRGIVSRIEFEDYYYGTMGLRIQVDAAINVGNSGGPALIGDKMVGIVFNHLEASDNIGYIIPNEEIDLFLADIGDGRYDGKATLSDVFHHALNPALRADLGLAKDAYGLLCRRPGRDDESYPLRARDLVVAIGGHPIDAAGKSRIGDDLRVDGRYFVQRSAKDGRVPMTVVRDGQERPIDLPVLQGPSRTSLLPTLMGRSPSYFIWGPMAFTVATEDLLNNYDAEGTAHRWYPYLTYNNNAMVVRRGERPRFEGEQLVVAAALFPHKITKGYTDPVTYVVDSVDGVAIRNLRHLAETLRDAKGDRIRIAFRDKNSEVFVFDRKEAEAASESILAENGIRNARSEDLKDLAPAAR